MAERKVKLTEFKNGDITITIPTQYDGKDACVEEKDLGFTGKSITLIKTLMNIFFFEKEDKEKHPVVLSPPATIKVKLDDDIEELVTNNVDVKLVWWNNREWVPFKSQKIDGDYCIAVVHGWPDDPAIGWGKQRL